MRLLGNARMYSVTPRTKASWNRLFEWVARRAGVGIDQIEHEPPKLLSDLWERDDLGAVMMCGLPLIRRPKTPRILAQCVPSLPRYAGKAVHSTDIVVAVDSPFKSLPETFGHRAGYTLKDSQSGYYAFRHHLLEHYASTPVPYRDITGHLMNARGIIRAIADDRIDVGPLDGYVYDLLKHTDPDFARQVRVLESTQPLPLPAIVTTADMDDATVERLQRAFSESIRTPDLAEDRAHLLLADFAFPLASTYDVLEERAQQVDAAPAWP